MTGRPLKVRIDRLVLRGVDAPEVGDLKGLVAQHLSEPSGVVSADEAPIPRGGRAMTEAAAARIAGEVRTRIAGR